MGTFELVVIETMRRSQPKKLTRLQDSVEDPSEV